MSIIYKNFIKELESIKDMPFEITTNEEWYGHYQHSKSVMACYLEDGEPLMTPEEYADMLNLDVETEIFYLDVHGILDPTKEVEEGYVVESGTAVWTLSSLWDYVDTEELSRWCDGAEDVLNQIFYEAITCAPVGVHEDESLLHQTITDYPESKLLWYNNYEVKSLEHSAKYPKELLDIIEKYETFNTEEK
jgi:hypothetical protein